MRSAITVCAEGAYVRVAHVVLVAFDPALQRPSLHYDVEGARPIHRRWRRFLELLNRLEEIRDGGIVEGSVASIL